jgi:hypothetical protein
MREEAGTGLLPLTHGPGGPAASCAAAVAGPVRLLSPGTRNRARLPALVENWMPHTMTATNRVA